MNVHAAPDDGGVWITCAELARRKGVSRQAVTNRVSALEADGRIKTRKDGRSRLVDLAEYDRAVGDTGDAAKEQAAETKSVKQTPALRDAQTERAQYEARLKALDLAERERSILPIGGPQGIAAASARVGEAIAQGFDGLPWHADDIAAAVSKDGVAGARRVLKAIAIAERQKVAALLMKIAKDGEAAEAAGPIETEIE
jgi:DNA-binding transcriptional ArsR family regulator